MRDTSRPSVIQRLTDVTETTPPPDLDPVLAFSTSASAERLSIQMTPTATANKISHPRQAQTAPESPFTNLVLAANISQNSEPIGQTQIFQPTRSPIYLFFVYQDLAATQVWHHEWRWFDLVLETKEQIWLAENGASGTAWVYFAPSQGFSPGPYSVILKVDGLEVASIEFLVQIEP